ncbi:whey acidic protein-like [Pyxicephalus adspersus]|uniref:whey acidic protein-like n=1 Tax=Pyxicephalus adspersus TaxID=30357 RepID=UPI003B5B6A13
MDSRIFLLLLLLGCAAVYTDKLPPSKGIVKPGNCPTDIKFACQYPITAEDECNDDGDCKDEKKCCKACVMSCLKPEFKDGGTA